MTSRQDIKDWISRASEKDTHMLVVCDTYDHDDYPVFVTDADDAKKKADEYNGKSMQRVMEVYNLKMPIDAQLNESRAFNY